MDAFGWAFALAWSRVTDARNTVRNATGPERLGVVNISAALVMFPTLSLLASAPVWLVILGTLWFLVQLLVDLNQVALNGSERARTLRLLEAAPTGAPRLARVRCSNGSQHTFMYGPNGWQETRPSTRDVPEPSSPQYT